MMDKIGATNLTLADAIAEVVANSFDAAVEGVRSEIDVCISADEISVVDGGCGMTEDVLAEAVRLGNDMNEIVKKRTDAKGRFGLGMKTACASMGRLWHVYTRPLEGELEYRVSFDLEDWDRRSNSPGSWSIEIEDFPRSAPSPLGDRPHGTAVVVNRLRQKNPLPGPVLQKIGESFKAHLAQKDIIRVNGDEAKPKEYKFIPGTKVDIDLRFGPSDGLRITGWVALDSQTHNDGNYGFNIYRHKQLVQTWNKEWFAAHLMTSRIIGEVEMDFIDATFFKLGLQQSEEWRLASAEMKEFMKPVARASQALSQKGNVNNPLISRDIISTMRTAVGAESVDAVGQFGGSVGDGPEGDTTPGTTPTAHNGPAPELPKLRVDLGQLVLEDDRQIMLTAIENDLSSPAIPFDLIFDDFHEVPQLQAVINTAHPLWTQSKDTLQLRILAVSDSIFRYLMNTVGMSPGFAAEARNAWIMKAMKEGWQ